MIKRQQFSEQEEYKPADMEPEVSNPVGTSHKSEVVDQNAMLDKGDFYKMDMSLHFKLHDQLDDAHKSASKMKELLPEYRDVLDEFRKAVKEGVELKGGLLVNRTFIYTAIYLFAQLLAYAVITAFGILTNKDAAIWVLLLPALLPFMCVGYLLLRQCDIPKK